MGNVLSKEKREQVIALGRLGWSLRRIEQATGVRRETVGLSPEGAEYRPDVYVRVPAFRESVFRAAAFRDGLQVADIVQVWLDISSQTAQGVALAKEICRRDLAPIFNEKS